MIDDSLHVAHLRMRSRAPLASPAGMSARIGDALRTASRPSAWRGRVVLIRRLRVRLPAGAPAHQMTSAIEREWQRLAQAAVEHVHASAASEAVWFAGQVEARLALIERLAAGADVSAWYWRRLLPLRAAVSPDEQLVALFAAPWIDLQVADVEQMRFARTAFAALRSKPRAMNLIVRLDETELRRLLPSLTEETAPWRRTMANERDAVPVSTGEPVEAASTAPASLHGRALRIAFSAIDGHSSERHDSTEHTNRRHADAALQRRARATTGVSAEGIRSDWAGLFFLLNLLPHAGDPPTTPRDTLAVVHAAATWLRIPADESIYDALAALDDHEPRPDVPPATVRALRAACVAATRRPLRRIVARPGLILITRTHLTTVFDLKSVRLDVRKAGLDLDPGWLPRLGRVVRFEYE